MGSASERMIEMQQEKNDRELAQTLGISYEELLELDHEIDTEESSDGMIYNYIVKFSDDAPKDILAKVIGIDEQNFVMLAPWEFQDQEYYQEQYDAIIESTDFLLKAQKELDDLRQLNNVELSEKGLEAILKRQTFSGAIGTLETFLCDTFINLTMGDETYFQNFVESFPEFKQRKFELRHLYVEQKRIKETARKIMLDIIYHDLPKVRSMYHTTFKIDFPSIKDLMTSVLRRHDLVHRNGKTKDGEIISVDKAEVENVIRKVSEMIEELAKKLKL